jgi:hypothetical protein
LGCCSRPFLRHSWDGPDNVRFAIAIDGEGNAARNVVKMEREIKLTDRARERGVSPLVNVALLLLMLSVFWLEVVSSFACGVMSR